MERIGGYNQNPHATFVKAGTNAHAGFGYNGRGVAMATSMGQKLARLVLDDEVPLSQQWESLLCCMLLVILALHGI